MSAKGFCVACPTSRSGFPHFPQTLFFNHDSDMTGLASSVERPSFAGEIPVFSPDWFSLSADSARLPPDAVSQLASPVDSLVLGRTDEPQVFESVVLLVFVDVVEAESCWNRSKGLLPKDDVLEPAASVECSSEIALLCECPAVFAFWFRSGF